ncbi:hypothetical protein GCM10027344_03670 [Spelaeicoccus albus]
MALTVVSTPANAAAQPGSTRSRNGFRFIRSTLAFAYEKPLMVGHVLPQPGNHCRDGRPP